MNLEVFRILDILARIPGLDPRIRSGTGTSETDPEHWNLEIVNSVYQLLNWTVYPSYGICSYSKATILLCSRRYLVPVYSKRIYCTYYGRFIHVGL